MAITGAPGKIVAQRRMLTYEGSVGSKLECSDELAVSSSDSVFGFLEGSVESTTSSEGYYEGRNDIMDEEGDEEDEESNLEENKSFWESQHSLLLATLFRTTALETGIRSATKEALKDIEAEGINYCKCKKAAAETGTSCRFCLMREVSSRLRNTGYNCAVCRSKWRSSPEVPSGEHTFLDVIDNTNPKKGEIRVIIELNFRAEFEMARASDDYNQLISRLPEVFVGKVERLRALIKILCAAAKKCMKDKKMHMGPWRKQKYVQAKWFSTCERNQGNATSLDHHLSKPARASILTTALIGNLTRTTVAVV